LHKYIGTNHIQARYTSGHELSIIKFLGYIFDDGEWPVEIVSREREKETQRMEESGKSKIGGVCFMTNTSGATLRILRLFLVPARQTWSI